MTQDHRPLSRLRSQLDLLAETFISQILDHDPAVTEGKVMTIGPPPYRRLDCDGRALAYIKSRPRRGWVRVDLTGLWRLPALGPLVVSSASGASLLIRSYDDADEASAIVTEMIERTRRAA